VSSSTSKLCPSQDSAVGGKKLRWAQEGVLNQASKEAFISRLTGRILRMQSASFSWIKFCRVHLALYL